VKLRYSKAILYIYIIKREKEGRRRERKESPDPIYDNMIPMPKAINKNIKNIKI